MKRKEKLRGQKLDSICTEDIVNLLLLEQKVERDRAGEIVEYTSNEQKIIIHGKITPDICFFSKIREDILNSYNRDINDTYAMCFLFLEWYKKFSKRIFSISRKVNIDRGFEIINTVLCCERWLSREEIHSRNRILSEKVDEDIGGYVLKEKIRFFNKILRKLDATEEPEEKIIAIIRTTISNCLYLQLINENKEIDNYFLLQWKYYPVNAVFQSVIEDFDNEITREDFKELKAKEKEYFDLVMKGDVKFDSLKEIEIKNRERKVYIVSDPFEKAVLNYLARRLKNEFEVNFPNRDKIMELAFNLIDSLPQLEDYTIYKFDFQDFFNSVDMMLVFDKYLKASTLYNYEKELIKVFARKYKKCVQGIPISNVLVEIIARDFDMSIQKIFMPLGLVFYKRYVDDCILIFNRRIEKEYLQKTIVNICRENFGSGVKLSSTKTSFQTKYLGDISFDYLGYSFERVYWRNPKPKKPDYFYFKFGIASNKLIKYQERLKWIFEEYETNRNEKMFLRRLQYFNSRIVFYNYNGSKYNSTCTWDVRGIINTYRMLRKYIIHDSEMNGKKDGHKRINEETYRFLKYFIREKRNTLSNIPEFLKGKGSDNHTLWSGFVKNRSIVFQPNIGWNNQYLNERLTELGIAFAGKSYYQKAREYSDLMIKKL